MFVAKTDLLESSVGVKIQKNMPKIIKSILQMHLKFTEFIMYLYLQANKDLSLNTHKIPSSYQVRFFWSHIDSLTHIIFGTKLICTTFRTFPQSDGVVFIETFTNAFHYSQKGDSNPFLLKKPDPSTLPLQLD